MMITKRTNYAPRTRGGALISSVAFAALAASASLPSIADAVTPVMGFGFVLTVVTIVYAPRLVRPGPGWFRTSVPLPVAMITYVGSGVVALAAVTIGWSVDPSIWGWPGAAMILAGGLLIAVLPGGRHGQR